MVAFFVASRLNRKGSSVMEGLFLCFCKNIRKYSVLNLAVHNKNLDIPAIQKVIKIS